MDSGCLGRARGAETGPKGTVNAFIRNALYRIKPIFTKLDPNYFEDSFKLVDQAIGTSVSQLDSLQEYERSLTNALSIRPMLEEGENEIFAANVFTNSVVNPCINLFNCLNPNIFLAGKGTVNYNCNDVPYTFYPDILIRNKNDNRNLLVIEVTKSGLEKYIVNDELVEDNDDFNSIIDQVTSYLIGCNLDEAIISDFRVSIYLRPQLEKYANRDKYPVLSRTEMTRNPTEYDPVIKQVKYVKAPYGYRIIRNTDCGVTLQAVVASMIYRQYQLSHPTEDLINSLKEILVMSAIDQMHTACFIAMIHTRRIMSFIQKSQKYWEVDKSRFYQTVIVDLEEELVPATTGPTYLLLEYWFSYKKYCKSFKYRGVSNNLPETVVLKVYDFLYLENYTNKYIEELRCLSLNDLYNVNDHFDYVTSLMLDEVADYESSKKLYDYGVIIIRLKGYPISFCYYQLAPKDEYSAGSNVRQ